MAPVTYVDGFVPDPDLVMAELLKLDWERRPDAPRSEYYCNRHPVPYTYGRGRGVRTYHPRPWVLVIEMVTSLVEAHCGVAFDVCFLNRYHNNRDWLGWHADDSPEMDDGRPIAVVSFGGPRDIQFRANGSVNVETQSLAHGSLLVMAPGMQDTHEHRIPKSGLVVRERISLTFRGYVATPLQHPLCLPPGTHTVASDMA